MLLYTVRHIVLGDSALLKQARKKKEKSSNELNGIWDREKKKKKTPTSSPHGFLKLESMNIEK